MDSIRIKVRIFIVITVPIASEHEPKWQYDHIHIHKINKYRLSGFTDLFTNFEEMRDLWNFLLLNFE
jgi:hypothetical protein